MADADIVAEAILWFILPALLIGAAILYTAYVAYDTRLHRLEKAAMPRPAGPDPVHELRRLNGEMQNGLAEGRTSLEKARETLRKGIRG